MQPHSLYLHIPFCRHRCGYCDFNTFAGLEALIPGYVGALCAEIAWLAATAGSRRPIQTIFFGGGTPSLVPAAQFARILQEIGEGFDISEEAEITLEANPEGLSSDYLSDLRSLGFNRLSLGMQSARPEELRLLERGHDYLAVLRAVGMAREAGFDNLNLDLIFGLPFQSLQEWQWSLNLALEMEPEHLSLYALTLEHGTPLAHYVGRGLLPEPDPDLAATMYEWSGERLEAGGYEQYEISNWARRDDSGEIRSCRHNLQYWRNQPYLGVGAGAHGYTAGFRTANARPPQGYIQRLEAGRLSASIERFPITPATIEINEIDRKTEMSETMFMGLRLTRDGISRRGFEERFGSPVEEVFGPEIAELVELGLLESDQPGGDRLRLTSRGRLLGNQVFMRFV
jgi:oxygen-independent coproporphyrinogen-3 oxidase